MRINQEFRLFQSTISKKRLFQMTEILKKLPTIIL